MPKMKINLGTPASPNWVVMDAKDADTLDGKHLSEIQADYNNKIGNLSSLNTTNKSNLVEAINEVKANSSKSANEITVADTSNYYTSTNVEGALQEIGQTLNAMRGSLITSVNNVLNM